MWDLCRRLRESQRDSANPTKFEKTLSEAFDYLGLATKQLGGPNLPDLVIEGPEVVIVEAKTTSQGSINEGYVNFDALERYEKKFKAQKVVIVAPSFSGRNLKDSAKRHNTVLMETEAICRMIQDHFHSPYSAEQIFAILFQQEEDMITPSNILPETDTDSIKTVIREILLLPENIVNFSVEQIDFLLKAKGGELKKDLIEAGIRFLSSPPLDIIERDIQTERFSFRVKKEIILKRISLVSEALEMNTHLPRVSISKTLSETPKGCVTAGQFEHLGDGVFQYLDNTNIRIDANMTMGQVKQELESHGLWTKNINSFRYQLRVKADLIN